MSKRIDSLAKVIEELFIEKSFHFLVKHPPLVEPFTLILKNKHYVDPINSEYEKEKTKYLNRRGDIFKKNEFLQKSHTELLLNLNNIHFRTVYGRISLRWMNYRKENKHILVYSNDLYTDSFSFNLNGTLHNMIDVYRHLIYREVEYCEKMIKLNEDELVSKKLKFCYLPANKYQRIENLNCCYDSLVEAGLFEKNDKIRFRNIFSGIKPHPKMRLKGDVVDLKFFIKEIKSFDIDILYDEKSMMNEIFNDKNNFDDKKKYPIRRYYEVAAEYFIDKNSNEITVDSLITAQSNRSKKQNDIKKAVNQLTLKKQNNV